MSFSSIVRARCASCPAVVMVDVCSVCAPDDPDAGCGECVGFGFTDEGEPTRLDDVLCHDCWTREQVSRTRDWTG